MTHRPTASAYARPSVKKAFPTQQPADKTEGQDNTLSEGTEKSKIKFHGHSRPNHDI